MDEKQKALWQRIGPIAYGITQRAETEPPYSGEYDDFFEKGLYVDIVDGTPIFTSMDKFHSGCGWPAFSAPVSRDTVAFLRDTTFGMERTEVRSAEADSHLGHVFSDGPEERGGLRYCINSAALRFIPYEKLAEEGYAAWISAFSEDSERP